VASGSSRAGGDRISLIARLGESPSSNSANYLRNRADDRGFDYRRDCAAIITSAPAICASIVRSRAIYTGVNAGEEKYLMDSELVARRRLSRDELTSFRVVCAAIAPTCEFNPARGVLSPGGNARRISGSRRGIPRVVISLITRASALSYVRAIAASCESTIASHFR